MPVVEYKRHAAPGGGSMDPPWISKGTGGYWYYESDKTLVGYVLHESDRKYYVPDTVIVLTSNTFCDRIETLVNEGIQILDERISNTEIEELISSGDLDESELTDQYYVSNTTVREYALDWYMNYLATVDGDQQLEREGHIDLYNSRPDPFIK